MGVAKDKEIPFIRKVLFSIAFLSLGRTSLENLLDLIFGPHATTSWSGKVIVSGDPHPLTRTHMRAHLVLNT